MIYAVWQYDKYLAISASMEYPIDGLHQGQGCLMHVGDKMHVSARPYLSRLPNRNIIRCRQRRTGITPASDKAGRVYQEW